MSVVVCYKRDNISIAATDSRTSYGFAHDAIISHDDTSVKLIRTPYGWSCGAGATVIIDAFKEKLVNRQIKQLGDIAECFSEAYEEGKNAFKDDYAMEMTKVVFTYSTFVDGVSTLRIGTLGKEIDTGEGAGAIKDSTLFVIYPFDIPRDLVGTYNQDYEKRLNDSNDLSEILMIVAELIKNVSNNSQTVSDICDFGISAITDDRVVNLHLRDRFIAIVEHHISGNLLDQLTIE